MNAPLFCRPSEAREMLARFSAGAAAARYVRSRQRDNGMAERVRDLVMRGFTVPQIAKIVDRDQTTVRHHCRALGLIPRPARKGRPIGAVNIRDFWRQLADRAA